MRYTGMTCEACGKVFEDTDDVVCCPICGAPHHRTCWLENGVCASSEKHAQGYCWKMPVIAVSEPEKNNDTTADGGNIKFPDGTHSVTCPHCGSENFPDDLYCRACHEQIKKDSLFGFPQEPDGGNYYADSNGTPQDNNNPFNRQQDIYNAYSLYGGLDPDSQIDGIPVREYADYIGKNSGNYVRKFSIAEHFRRKAIWSWTGALFGPVWFFARKQTKIGALMCAVIILLSAIAGVLSMSTATLEYVRTALTATQKFSEEYASGGKSYEQAMEELNKTLAESSAEYNAAKREPRDIAAVVLEYLIITGSVLFGGFYGNYCYKNKVKKDILDSREKCTSAESYRAMLISRGGISAGYALLGVLLQLVSYALLTYLPIIYVSFTL